MKSPSEIARGIAEYMIGEPHGELESVIIEAITTERKRQERLVEALEVYADRANWMNVDLPSGVVGYGVLFKDPMAWKGYIRAQQVLKEVK